MPRPSGPGFPTGLSPMRKRTLSTVRACRVAVVRQQAASGSRLRANMLAVAAGSGQAWRDYAKVLVGGPVTDGSPLLGWRCSHVAAYGYFPTPSVRAR